MYQAAAEKLCGVWTIRLSSKENIRDRLLRQILGQTPSERLRDMTRQVTSAIYLCDCEVDLFRTNIAKVETQGQCPWDMKIFCKHETLRRGRSLLKYEEVRIIVVHRDIQQTFVQCSCSDIAGNTAGIGGRYEHGDQGGQSVVQAKDVAHIVEVSRVEEPKDKVVVGDACMAQASQVEGSKMEGLEQRGLAGPVPNSCK